VAISICAKAATRGNCYRPTAAVNGSLDCFGERPFLAPAYAHDLEHTFAHTNTFERHLSHFLRDI
jgi:hypothetical protein